MKTQGVSIGLAVAAVAWAAEASIASGRVSTFPDALSLIVLVVAAAFALRDVDRAHRTRAATVLGVSAGIIVAASTALRGALRWSTPDVTMLLIAFGATLVLVVGITHAVAFFSRPRAA